MKFLEGRGGAIGMLELERSGERNCDRYLHSFQQQILDYWNSLSIPADAGYFADAVRRKARELGYPFPIPNARRL